MTRTRSRWLAPFLVLGLVAAACGDDDDADAPEGTAAPTETEAPDDTGTTEAPPDDATTTTAPPDDGGEAAAGECTFENLSGLAVSAEGESLNQQVCAVLGQPELFGRDAWGETTRGVTEDSIKVGGVNSVTIAGSLAFAGICEGAAARFARSNADGETLHTIDFDVENCLNDDNNPDTHAQQVRDLINDEEIFALLPATSQSHLESEFYQEERLVNVGWGFNPPYCSFANSFGFGDGGAVACGELTEAGYDTFTQLTTQILADAYENVTGEPLGDVRLASVSENVPAGIEGIDRIQIQAEQQGWEVVYNEAGAPDPSAGPPGDWTPLAQEILDSDPNVVFMTTSGTPGLYAKLRELGYEGIIQGFVFCDPGIPLAAPELAAQLDGSYQMCVGIGSVAFDNAGTEQLAADAESYGFAPALAGIGFLHGYAAADLFVAMVQATEAATADDPSLFSAEAMHDAVNSGWEYPGMDGVVCGTVWPAAHVVGSPCGSVTIINAQGQSLDPGQEPTYYPLEIREIE